MNENTEDPQLLSIAESISDRQPVDWSTLQRDVPAEQAAVVEELRALEHVARLAEHSPTGWGPYAIIEEIGHGVFGTVYRAHDPELRRDVALKVVRPPHPEAVFDPDRALEEARHLAKVTHPNVVKVLRADRIGDEVGISMDLIAGETLDALVKQRGRFSAGEAALIGLDLCRALAAVHGTQTLHGDIKAHNVMRSASGDIILTDFGTSKDLGGDQVPGGDFAGTPLYLAPEVFKGASRTMASDIYSLGVLLYYLVTASYPVDGSTKTELASRHTDPGARRLLRDVRPDLSEAFIGAVERALAESPDDRYPSAGAFEAALRPVVSRPAPPPPFAHPKIVSLVIALVIVTAGVLVMRPWASRKAPSPSPEAVVAAAPGTYRVDAAIYREQNKAEVRLASGSRVSVGDKLSLQLETSVPAYVYVVNEDESGEAFLLFPLPGHPIDVPLAAGRHRLPGMRKDQRLSWRITTPGLREHFVIFVTPERSTTFEKLFASLPAPTEDAPEGVRLPKRAIEQLRAIGGLTAEKAPAEASAIRNMPGFSTPLPAGAETASGLWVRQVAFENPASR
jgi:eukaryotic-like serine/threonine-protein kinase